MNAPDDRSLHGMGSCPGLSDSSGYCPGLVDVKAFKGKGAAWTMLNQVRVSLEEVWREMATLAVESSHLRVKVYIQVHRYPGLSKHHAVAFLRWRLRQSGQDAHVSWPQVESLVAGQALPVRRYYWNINQRMLDLNCLAAALQQVAIRLLLRLSDRSARQPAGEDAPKGVELFIQWVAGKVSLADFDMRENPLAQPSAVEAT